MCVSSPPAPDARSSSAGPASTQRGSSATSWRDGFSRPSSTVISLGMSLRPIEVNGGPGALILDGQQRLIGVWALDIAGGQITSISSIVNPDKLTHLGPVADLRSLLRSAR
jgi:hypothetical protein